MILGDRFEIRELAGLGTAASVYRAHDRTLGSDAAVKVLHAGMVDSPDIVARFRAEGDLLARFAHPHILTFRARGVQGRQPWLATDYASGRSLADRVLARAGVNLHDLLACVIDVLGALAYVHRLGVIHRDVKPENILIGATGRGFLADFGIARSPSSDLTAQGQLLGTPSFCPPEQMLDPTRVTPQSDVYAVGVTLFTSVTRQSGMALAVHTLRARALAMLTPGLGPIVERATAIDPEARYPSAEEMSEALEALRQRPAGSRSAR